MQNSLDFCAGAGRMLAQRVLRSNPLVALFLCIPATLAAESSFLGKNSCSSSSCHGGGGASQNQNIVWANKDQHSRAPATLGFARSKRIGQLLNISDPARDDRCTSCHAPWQNLPAKAMPANCSIVEEAVSCETCHGPASNYIRSHTRKDLSRSEKLLEGLRDLTILYNRANSCVACHQRVDSRLLQAGHPELLFELDGQTASMPRHWRERETNTHAATWLTGQAAALRELTAQMIEEAGNARPSERVSLQWQSALWVLSVALPESALSGFSSNSAGSVDKLKELHSAADKLALNAPGLAKGREAVLLKNLLTAGKNFSSAPAGSAVEATKAERLVIAIDRLLYLKSPEELCALQDRCNAFFALVQSRPDFSPEQFSRALGELAAAVNL